MPRVSGAAPLLRSVLLSLFAVGIVAAPASALSMQPLVNDAENVVQQGEADVAPDSSTIPQDTERFLAHAYAFGTASSGNPLGAVAGPVLRFRYIGKKGPSTFVTLLDFDRDFLPDLAVRYEPEIKNESGTSDTTAVSLYDVKGLGTYTCLSDLPAAKRIGSPFDVGTENPNEGAANGQIPLKTAYGSAGLTEGLMRTVPPRMVTIVTANFGSATIKPNRTTYPAAAKNDDNTACAGLGYDFGSATGHTTGATDDSTFERADATPSTEIVNADLRRIAVKQWSRTSTREDAVVGTNQAARTTYPSELSIDFGSTKGVASLTYLWAAKTWTRTTARSMPNALIRTESVSGNANRVRVIVTSKLGQGSLNDVVKNVCLSRAPTGGASLVSTFEFPLIEAGGNRRLTLALDDLLGSGSPAVSGTGTSKTWRFQSLSDPGADAGASIDTVPALAGYSVDGSERGAGCAPSSGTDGGAQVILDRTHTVGVAQPKVDLIPSTLNPARSEDVTFTLDTDPGDRLCSLTPTFALAACTNLTQRYTQAKTDTYLTLDAPSGAWDADRETIALGNSRPVAAIGAGAGTQPPVGTDGSLALVRGNAVSLPLAATGTDADPGTSYTYAWTLDGQPVSETSASYTPTFTTPGTYTVGLVVDDGSGQGNAQSVQVTRTITVVRSPAGDVSIDQPARSVAGQPFDLAAQLASAGHQALTWTWDLDGDATFTADPARTGKTLTNVVIDTPGERIVRVRATDAGGRTADAAITINVRRANERPPVASFTVAPATLLSGAPATFDASQSQLSDTDGTLLGPIGAERPDVRYRWDFGDGTPTVTTAAPVTSHTFAGSGPVRVTLIVEDARAEPTTLSNPKTTSIDVGPGATDANAPRVAFVRQDPPPADPVFAGRLVTVTAAGSTAADGHAPLTYAFDLDGNGSFERENAAEPTVRFTPAAAGPLTVSVRVTDALGAQTVKTLALTVEAEPIKAPTATVTGPAQLNLTGLGVSASYDATGSRGNNLDPALTYRWDLDEDGTFETPTGADPKVTAGFSSPGLKTVTVRVEDRYGNQAEAKTTTVVRSPADVAAGCTGRSSLQEVAYKTVRARGCALTVARPSAGPLYVLTGAIRVNGLALVDGTGSRGSARPFADCASADCVAVQTAYNAADAGLQVTLDPSDGALRSNKPASLRASGSGIDLPLGSGPLNVALPSNPQDTISLSARGGTDLFGFPLAGPVAVRFPDDGETTITLTVSLPVVAGGFTGQASIRVTSTGAVVFDELKIDVGEITIGGKLSLGNLSFAYSRLQDLWAGGGSITLPTPKAITISANVEVQRNKFKSIRAEVSGINQPIAQGIFLQALRAGVAVDPLDLTAGIQVSAGPAVKNKSVLALDGDLRLKFPSALENYYLFALTGKLSFADFQLATGFAQFSSNGFFEMGGGIDADFKIAYLKAYLKGWISANAFNVDGDAEVGLQIAGSRYGLAAAHVTMSTTGFGACGGIPVLDLYGGFGARWGSDVDAFWGCDLAPYRAARPANAPATPTFGGGARAVRTDATRGRLLVAGPKGHAITIPKNAEKVMLTAQGASAPPRLTIVDAKGRIQLSTPADGSEALTKRMLVKANPEKNTTQVLWKAPTAGTLYVLSQAGSSPTTSVDVALPEPERTYEVSVDGKGEKRRFTWAITPALKPGQTVTLAEEGAAAGTELAVTAESTGSVAFVPQGGKAGKRAITATVVTDGLPAEKKVVGSYIAPEPPRPAKPTGVTLKRSAAGVLVRWKAPKAVKSAGGGAAVSKWKVLVRVAHTGRKQMIAVPAGQRSLRIDAIDPADPVSVEVSAAGTAGNDSAATKAIVKAGLRASSGPLASFDTTKPRDVKVRRLSDGRVRVTWKTGGAFVRGWSIRVSRGAKGERRGPVTLLRAAGDDRSVDVVGVPKGKGTLRVSVIGRRFQGPVTRKDVRYLGQ